MAVKTRTETKMISKISKDWIEIIEKSKHPPKIIYKKGKTDG